ncbi:MAG: pyridoxal phosphate-dependent aminotransferase [Leptospira sp.]|nr:pyridoxal phosphate-dependent aminotransferase [Leptospira sp.]
MKTYLSDKASYSEEENELTLLQKKLRVEGRKILDLTVTNPTALGFEYDGRLLGNAISSSGINQYNPDPRGMLQAREAIAGYYRGRNIFVDPGDLYLTSGTSEALSILLKLLCDPGDEILIPSPGYPLFEMIAALENIGSTRYHLTMSDGGNQSSRWEIDFQDLENRITHKTKAIILIQPNNPTGSVLSGREAVEIVKFSERNGIPLIVDEVFSEYLDPGEKYSFISSGEIPVFTLNGISKMLLLPQMKLAWIHAGSSGEMKKILKHSLDIICDTYLTVNTPVQLGLHNLFEIGKSRQEEMKKRLKRNMFFAHNIFDSSSEVRLIPREGGWSLVLEIGSESDDENFCVDLLLNHNVLVHPGYMFDFTGKCFIILSVIVPEEEFAAGIRLIQNCLHSRKMKK